MTHAGTPLANHPGMLRPSSTTLTSLVLTLGLLSACDSADELDAASSQEAEIIETIDNLERAGFPSDDIDVNDEGQVIVGGDAVVSLQASREMIGEGGDEGFRQYHTDNMVAPSIDTICVDLSGVLSDTDIKLAVEDAIGRYNALNLNFEMAPTLGPQSWCDAVIETALQSGTSASAGFPMFGRPYNEIIIGTDIPDYGDDVTRHVVMHELGHCVGLRHTDYFDRSYSCGTGGNEGSAGVGANHVPGTTSSYDSNSVMNSCYSSSAAGEWSTDDDIALHVLY
jgi:hypothetical protein